jgi:serine/threonine protein kinase
MTPERWQRIDQLVQEALSLDHTTRNALLDAKCNGDTELRREVESLIDTAAVTLNFLEQNALEDGAGLFNTTGSSLPTGHQVGHYVIQNPLGAGGMGEVYLARDLKLGRLVALKVLDAELTTDETTRSRFFAKRVWHPRLIILTSARSMRSVKLMDASTSRCSTSKARR